MNAIILTWGVLSGAVFLDGKDVASDAQLAALQGTWKVTSSTVNGKPLNDRQMSGSLLTFSGNELLLVPGDGSERERFKIKHEAGSAPPAFHVTRTEPANRPQSGWEIYEVKGERLRIALFDALRGRPISFDPRPKQIVLELEKVAKRDAGGNQ